MDLRTLLTAVAVVVAFSALIVSIWSARRTQARDVAHVVLRYTEDEGLVTVVNEGPATATAVALLATAPNLVLDPNNIGTLKAGEDSRMIASAIEPFKIYLSWRDAGARVHQKKYEIVPGAVGFQGDGWPPLIQSMRVGRTISQSLKELDRKGRWKYVRADLFERDGGRGAGR